MGEVVLFPLGETKRDPVGSVRSGGTCQIMLFMGVRYERHALDEPSLPPTSELAPEGSGRRRKARRRA
jgi:hypothetical protein